MGNLDPGTKLPFGVFAERMMAILNHMFSGQVDRPKSDFIISEPAVFVVKKKQGYITYSKLLQVHFNGRKL